MKKITLIIYFSCQFVFSVYSQFITLNIENATVKDVIERVQAISNYSFIFETSDLDTKKIISISSTNEPISKIVEQIIKGQDLSYTIKGNSIILFKNTNHNNTENEIITINAKVVDKNELPIPGAFVSSEALNTGTITDIAGNFTINILNNSAIKITHIGFETKTVYPNLNNPNKIILFEQNLLLDELVVVGYGTQKKESVVGAISTITGIALQKSGTQSISNALAGKLPGVLTLQQSGEPGNNAAEIIIRGVSSWKGSAPLVMIDGIERDFNDIDINEIESISILKDASASAVFGVKGANGVLLLKTKQGLRGESQMNFNFSSGIIQAKNTPSFIDSHTTMSLLNVAFMNGQQFQQLTPKPILDEYKNPSSIINHFRYPNVNWLDLLTNKFAPTSNLNLNISGGSDFIRYFGSFGIHYEGSLFKNYQQGYVDSRYTYRKINYRTNIDVDLTQSTLLSLKVGGSVQIKNQPLTSPWEALYATSPARFPAYFPEWLIELVPDPIYPNDKGPRQVAYFGEFYGNPYSILNSGSFNQFIGSKLFTDILLSKNLSNLIPGLMFKSKIALSTFYENISMTANYSFPQYQLDYSKINVPGANPWSIFGSSGNDIYTQPLLDVNIGGLQDNFYYNLYYEAGLEYNQSFGQHNVYALLLGNRQQKNISTRFPFFNESLIGRTTYNFANKYFVEFNAGYTGSEQFAQKNRYGFFPSIAFGWLISEERFFQKSLPFVDKCKLRISDGMVGSDISTDRWLYIGEYSNRGNFILENEIANTSAQWETARKQNLGVEASFFKNKLRINLDFFNELRNKILLKPQNISILVGNSFKEINLGSIKKHGFEIDMEYQQVLNANLNFHIRGLFSFSENRVINKDDPKYMYAYQKAEGKPLDAQQKGVILTGKGYFTSIDDIHNNPAPISIEKLNVGDYKYLDYMVDGIINSGDQYPIKGSLYPPIIFSLNQGFRYKNFDFNFMLLGNIGKYINYNQIFEAEFNKGNYRLQTSQLDYWTPINQNANHATLHYNESNDDPNLSWGGGEAYNGYNLMIENRFWRNADFLRLKEIYASYTLNSKEIKKKYGINSATIYLTATNLFTFTNLIEGDPERKDFLVGFYPLTSNTTAGIKISF